MAAKPPQGVPWHTAAALWLLLFLFVLRVLGQILVAFFDVAFLPPMARWYSGLLPYPWLLLSQAVIILLYGRICIDFTRGRGFFVIPRWRFGICILAFGAVYLSLMLARYGFRMSLYPAERWTGGSIPTFFHWVLAAFLLILGAYHWTHGGRSPKAGVWRYPLSGPLRVLLWGAVLIALAVVLSVGYDLAPRPRPTGQPGAAGRGEQAIGSHSVDLAAIKAI